MDISEYNQRAWDQLVDSDNEWTRPVSSQVIQRAKSGDWSIVLTPHKPVPRDWFGELQGKRVLCLASGGGQQGPTLAAAGADVTVYDLSEKQLGQDRLVAQRDGLQLKTVSGDMRDLSALKDQSFELIVHPCSNTFIPDINPVWREAYRVLVPGGQLMSGFVNPLFFLFDYWDMEDGQLNVKYSLPFSDLDQLSTERLQQLRDEGETMTFGHTLQDQIGGQLHAGFQISSMFEDTWDAPPVGLLSKYIPSMLATLAVKPVA